MDADSSERGSYAKGVARRQEILDRAIEVFAARGAEKTSLRAIGEAIGISHAALKHYFASREELLVAVYREAESRTKAQDPAGQGLVADVTGWARRNHEVPGLVQLYSTLVATALEDGHPEARAFATDRFAASRARIAARIAEQQDAGTVAADLDPTAAAALVIAVSDGLQIQWLLDPTLDHEGALRLLDRLLAP